MNIVLNRLEAMLPTQAAAAQGSAVAAPPVLRGWLDDLPLANRGFALMRLHEALREFNSVLMAPRQRLAMLEMFEFASAALVDDARNEVREFFPMSPERIDEIKLAAEIEHEKAIGYIDAVCGLAAPSGKVSFLQRGLVAKALMRASACQKTRLWLACRTHSAPAKGVWQALHDLFGFAVDCGCDARESTLGDAGHASVRLIYTQALLLAFARPNQFTQAQNRQLHTALPVLASWCDVRANDAPTSAIAVSATSDASPPVAADEADAEGDPRWMLDVSALLAKFNELLTKAAGANEIALRARRGSDQATLAADLVDALKRAWCGRTAREFPRSAETAVLETEVGLAGLHSLLAGSEDVDSVVPLSSDLSLPVASWALRTSAESRAKRAHAEVMDFSRRGYRLRWGVGEDARARVGELIALASTARGERKWHYGALRWLRTQRNAAVEAGVELLPSPIPVAVYALDAHGLSRAPVRGILIGASPDDSSDTEPGILVPRPFSRDAVALDVLRVDESELGAALRPVRVAKFTARAAGLYQKILVPEDAIARLRGSAEDGDSSA